MDRPDVALRAMMMLIGSPDLSPLVNAVVADPARPGTWYLGSSSAVLKSRDGGESWEPANRGAPLPRVRRRPRGGALGAGRALRDRLESPYSK